MRPSIVFFKQVARHTNCFKNIPLTLARKHQLVIAHHLHMSDEKKQLVVTNVSSVPIDVLQSDIATAFNQRLPDETDVHIAKNVSYNGMNYSKGMIVIHGESFGLPEFAEILQLFVLEGKLHFFVRKISAWYREHFRAFELSTSHVREVAVIAHEELVDEYPLAAYSVGGLRLVTLKRSVSFLGKQN